MLSQRENAREHYYALKAYTTKPIFYQQVIVLKYYNQVYDPFYLF